MRWLEEGKNTIFKCRARLLVWTEDKHDQIIQTPDKQLFKPPKEEIAKHFLSNLLVPYITIKYVPTKPGKLRKQK